MLTLDNMQNRWPNGNQRIPGLLEGIVATAEKVFATYGLTSPLLVAHAMAQFSEECCCGTEMMENMNYSVQGLLSVFPSHFTAATAAQAAHNPQLIAEIAYGGRCGNAPPPSTDGFVFRGAGLSQVTGRSGVTSLQAKLDSNAAGFNILTNPALIIDPAHALECGVADFIVCGCLPHAQADDVVGVTRALNGGLNGLDQRRQQLALWKTELGV
jgi:putative chitinase